jgi:transcriptional regulator with XRE-family HTH domain
MYIYKGGASVGENVYLGKNIRYLRKKRNLKQEALAKALNVPRTTLSCWETGIRTPKVDKIIDIANYFGTDLNIIYKDLSKEK